jgi:hypothetical protein
MSKYRWNTVGLLAKLAGLGRSVQSTGFGGDHDTNAIEVNYDMSRRFYIQGWDVENCLDDITRDDTEVDAITCYDGQYQDVAVSGSDPGMIQLYADILKVLMLETDGTETGITNHWKQLF